MPKISVIIPVYKAEGYIKDCLDSVFGQGIEEIEVICINDGSPDNSGVLLEEYAQKEKRLKVIHQPNKGPSAARNAGIDVATGEWIFFLDSDDLLAPNALQTLYDTAVKTGVFVVASRKKILTSELKEAQMSAESNVQLFKNGLKDFVLDTKIFSAVWGKLFKKEVWDNIRFKEGIVFEDWPVMTILFGRYKPYATLQTPCVIYRDENESITRSAFSVHKVESYLCGIRLVYEAFKESAELPFARQRMAVAAKMATNKVYHAKDKEVDACLIKGMNALKEEGILLSKDLPFKTKWRLWRIQHR